MLGAEQTVAEHGYDWLDYLTAFGTIGAALAAAAAAYVAYRQTRLTTRRSASVRVDSIESSAGEAGAKREWTVRASIVNQSLLPVTVTGAHMGYPIHPAVGAVAVGSKFQLQTEFEPGRIEPGEFRPMKFGLSAPPTGMIIRVVDGAGNYFSSDPIPELEERPSRWLHPLGRFQQWRFARGLDRALNR
jgi:hypothetical protein